MPPPPTNYRQDDPISGRWTGLGRLLTKYEFDLNNYQFDTRITTLEDNYSATVSLASVSQPTPSTLLFTKTDASTDGPFTLPIAVFTDHGDWAIDTPYIVNDTFTAPDGGLYRVTFNHTSSHTSFDPAANDGMGHDFYAPMIPPRGNTIPAGGAVGMYFRKNSTTDYDANWASLRANEIIFAPSTDSTLVSTIVADALDELDGKIATLAATPVSVTALEVSYTPSTGTVTLTSTNVADALEELDANAAGFPPASDGYNASPSGNVSTTEKAMGLGVTSFTKFTPTRTGNLMVWFSGVALNATAAGDGTTITGRYGAVDDGVPNNGATTGLGTAFGLPQHFVASTTAGQQGFTVMGVVSGLEVGTQYWFDLSLVAVTGGGATVKDVQWLALEVAY